MIVVHIKSKAQKFANDLMTTYIDKYKCIQNLHNKLSEHKTNLRLYFKFYIKWTEFKALCLLTKLKVNTQK